MAFGFRYWMVFLPETESQSFLLFVHNPAGATKLRNYASGREQVIGQPGVDRVFRTTEEGKTRHECEPHRTDDNSFWYQKTQELNRRYLSGAGSGLSPQARVKDDEAARPRRSRGIIAGRAVRGSQRQLQDYVNEHPDVLSNAVLGQLPARMKELEARIRWVSPLAHDGYREYRDADFLERVGLLGFAKELAEFWPSMGPSWDGLGIVSDASARIKPGVILVEAKSHIAEIYGSGCQASKESSIKIEAAIGHARSWCGALADTNWLGPLYQSANRIAHLYLLYERSRTPVWLVNLYFTGDPIGPVDLPTWEREVASVKAQLGLTRPVPNMIEVFLPALGKSDVRECEEFPQQPNEKVAPAPLATTRHFELWAERWMDLASFAGAHLIEPAWRIAEVLDLWTEPVPGNWERGIDAQLLGARYRRGDFASPHAGEHAIEYEILSQLEVVRCLEGSVVDGINAMPLARDETGGRRGNVEGDLLLLVEKDDAYRLVVCEVKDSANTCWYAAVESLRQLKLLQLSVAVRQLFHHRNKHLTLPTEIPLIGLVVAPVRYYPQPGQKANVLPHAIRLLNEFSAKTGVEAHLATWDAGLKAIRRFCPRFDRARGD